MSGKLLCVGKSRASLRSKLATRVLRMRWGIKLVFNFSLAYLSYRFSTVGGESTSDSISGSGGAGGGGGATKEPSGSLIQFCSTSIGQGSNKTTT